MEKLVEDQQAQIQKYKGKLRDVIQAYKSLLAEKEALETTVNSLTEPKKAESKSSENPDELGSEKVESSESHGDLVAAIKTLTDEKAKNEMALKADKKGLLKEKRKLERTFMEQQEKWEAERKIFEQQLSEIRANTRKLQSERSSEQTDHSVQLKELQVKLTQERTKAENLERKFTLLHKELQAAEDSSKEVVKLRMVVDDMQEQLKEAELRARQAPCIGQLKDRMADLKVHHDEALRQEQTRTLESEAHLNQLGQESEQKIGILEKRIAELSQMLGDCEKRRSSDQSTIDRLKLNIVHLEQEYQTISKELNLLLKNPLSDLNGQQAQDIHTKCREDYEQLLSEFNHWKSHMLELAAEDKNQSFDEKSKQVQELTQKLFDSKCTIDKLQSKIKFLSEQAESLERNFADERQRLNEETQNREFTHKQELSELRGEFEARISEFQAEMQKQRERALGVINDGLQSHNHLQSPINFHDGSSKPNMSQIPNDPFGSNEDSAFSTDDKDVHNLVLFREETSKKDGEISKWKERALESETRVQHLEHSSVAKELRNMETIEVLKRELQKVEEKLEIYRKNEEPGGKANWEYLRNVLVNYFSCTGSDQQQKRKHMLKAIGKLLALDAKQLQQIITAQENWRYWKK